MYSSERSSGFNWKDIITKLLFITLFIFLLLWLFPKVPNMTAFYSNVFRENINYMQEAAVNYYTNERLPKNVGDVSEMTLQDMIDKSLILPFVDKDGKSCDTKASYVQVTKGEKEYILKVNLVCEDESNYIKEPLGCHDYCDNCEAKVEEPKVEEPKVEEPKVEELKKEEPKKETVKKEVKTETTKQTVTEYEFKQAIKNSNTTYSCPDGYILDGTKCSKTVTGSRILATKVYSGGEKIEVPAKKYADRIEKEYGVTLKQSHTETSYYCSSGEPYSGSGSNLVCKIKVSKVCPSSEYTLNGNSCTITKSKVVTGSTCDYSSASVYTGKSSVPSGSCVSIIKSYSSCSTSVCSSSKTLYDYKVGKSVTKSSCPDGYNTSGTKCVRTVQATCPSGSTNLNGTCYKSGTKSSKTSTYYTYSCPSSYPYEEGSGANLRCYRNKTITGNYYCEDPKMTYSSCSHTCKYTTEKVLTGYTCPTGYNRDGEYCYKTSTSTINAKASTNTTTTYNYKWSRERTIQGWTATGKTRTVSI